MKPGGGDNSLIRRMNSLLGRGKFPASLRPGICVQRAGIAARIHIGNGPKGGKYAKFPVIFRAIREFADRDSGSTDRLRDTVRAYAG